MKTEGSQLSEEIGQLKLPSSDGKLYKTDVVTTQQLFRLIQSIPSPKAEPFKMWMAQVAKERLDEMQDPELTINRAMMEYKSLGYSDNWINQRLKSIEVRKELTDEWKRNGMQEGVQFATLTDIIYQTWAGKTAKEKNPQHLEEHDDHHSRTQHPRFQARKELRSEGEITDNKNLLKFKDYAKRKEA